MPCYVLVAMSEVRLESYCWSHSHPVDCCDGHVEKIRQQRSRRFVVLRYWAYALRAKKALVLLDDLFWPCPVILSLLWAFLHIRTIPSPVWFLLAARTSFLIFLRALNFWRNHWCHFPFKAQQLFIPKGEMFRRLLEKPSLYHEIS